MPLRVVISDSSCLIDLRRASLLDAFVRLPYELLIPDTLFEEELLKFSAAQKKALLRGGLKVVELPGEGVLRAREVVREFAHLSVHDGFAYALAESRPGCILLTGDGPLRAFAQRRKIEVHGVLWVIDELYVHNISKPPIAVRCPAVAGNGPDSAVTATRTDRILAALRWHVTSDGGKR